MTWYINTGTESVPGLPVGLPVTVECREMERPEPGAEQPAWQELPGRFEALAESPPQPMSSSAQRIAASAGTAPFHAVRIIPASVYIPAAVVDGGITRMVHSGGVELAVFEAGDARRPTLIFIHGYPDTKELWDEVLGHLGQRYHLVAYDVRGAGRSRRPRGTAAYDLARLADDLDAVIAAVSPRRPVHLVGHDWGAIQGWEFVSLERFRNKLASFTAIAGPPLDLALAGGAEPVRPPAGWGWGDSPATRASQPWGRSALGLARLPWRLRRSWYIVGLCTPGIPTLTWRWLLTAPRW